MATTLEAILKLKADVTGEGDVNKLSSSLSGIKKNADTATSGFKSLTTSASGLLSGLTSLAPMLTGAGLVAMAKSAIDTADNMNDLAQKTGVSVESLSQFSQAAEMSGTTLDKVGGALIKFNKNLVDGKSAEALSALGISAEDANGKLKPTEQLLLEVADKFAAMPDGAEKSALAMELFGKSGADLIPMLNMGSDAIEELGVTMTTDFAQKADAFNDKMVELQTAFGEVGVAVGTLLMPFLTAAADALVGIVATFETLPGWAQTLTGAVLALAAAFVVLSPAITAIISLGGAVAGLGLGATITGWLGAVGPTVTGITTAVAGFSASIAPILATIGGLFQSMLAVVTGVFTGPVGWAVLIAAAIAALWVFQEPISDFVSWVGETLWGWVEGLWELAEPIRQFWTDVWASVQEIATGFFTWFGSILYDWFVQPWVDLGTTLYEAVVLLWEQIKEPVLAFFTWWGEFLYTGYVEPWLVLGEQLVAAATDVWSSIQQAVSGFFNWVLETANTYLYEPIAAALQGVQQLFYDVWNPVQEFLVGWFAWWGEFLYKAFVEPVIVVLEAVGDLFAAGFEAIGELASGVWDSVVDAWEDAVKMFEKIWGSITDWFGDNVTDPIASAWEGLMDNIGELVDSAVAVVSSAWNAFVESFNDYVVNPILEAWNTLGTQLGDALSSVTNVLSGIWNSFQSAVIDSFSAIADAFNQYVAQPLEEIWNGITDAAGDALDSLVDAVTSAYDSIASAVSGAFNGILGSIGSVVNQIIDAINSMINGANSIRSAVGLSALPTIPRVNWATYAEGGVVTGPTAAIVGEGGEPEYIIPASKMQAAAANYLSGLRGEAVINSRPRGLAVAGATPATPVISVGNSDTQVSITTGPVQQIGAGRYVSVDDLQAAVSTAARQVKDSIMGDLSQPGVRQRLGMA